MADALIKQDLLDLKTDLLKEIGTEMDSRFATFADQLKAYIDSCKTEIIL